MTTWVLICDDHPLFRGGLAAALADEPGLALAGEVGSLAELRARLAAGDRLDGGEAGAGERIDLVLLDVDLPDGNGLDVVAEVAARAPVIVLSAYDDPHLVRRALEDGALGHIRKDAEPLDLLRLVRRGAAGKTVLSGDMALRLATSLRRGPDARAFEDGVASLTPRQRQVLALIAEGRTNREIAGRLHLSEGTVKNYVTRILDVAGVGDRTKLALLAVRHERAR